MRYIIFLLFLITSLVHADEDRGSTSGNFLKIIPVARYKALGEAVVEMANDAAALL